MAAPLFMGFDLSTQQLKVLVIDKDLKVVTEASVHFDNDFPEFKTQGGVHQHKDKLTVTAPTLLWVKAFDLVLKRLKENGLEFGAIACVSGTGQQHGSVYWKNGARETLKNLQSGKSLYDQFQVQGVHLMYGWSTHFILFLPNIAPFFNFDKLNSDGCDKSVRYAALLWWLEGWIPQ